MELPTIIRTISRLASVLLNVGRASHAVGLQDVGVAFFASGEELGRFAKRLQAEPREPAPREPERRNGWMDAGWTVGSTPPARHTRADVLTELLDDLGGQQ